MKLKDFSHRIMDFVTEPNKEIDSLVRLLSVSTDEFFRAYEAIDAKEFTQIKGFESEIDGEARKRIIRIRLEELITLAVAIIPHTIQNDYVKIKSFYDLFFEEDGRAKEAANVKLLRRNALYHIATTDKYETKKRGELFVLPNKLLHKSKKFRYNQDGAPCIYMGSTLYNAWEETRRPDFDKANFVLFKPQKMLRVMSIYIEPQMHCYGDFVMAYFTMVSALKTNDDDKYHYQYVVPNLFMSILTHANSVCGKDVVDGIRYLSSRGFDGKDYQFNSHDIDEAFVFPQRLDTTGTPDDSYLRKLFLMSDPRNYFYYQVHRCDFSKGEARATEYRNSLFHAIEVQLKKEPVKMIDKEEK